jgi:hypothetical protein
MFKRYLYHFFLICFMMMMMMMNINRNIFQTNIGVRTYICVNKGVILFLSHIHI